MTLVDANLLIYMVDASSPNHDKARRCLEAALSGTRPVGLAITVLLAFLRITTHRAILRNPLTPDAAIAYIDEWLALPNVTVVVPGKGHWEVLRSLLLNTGTAGNLTSDAHLAAIAIENGATVCSADDDFARFPGIRYVNPLR